jgi:hypothetical protein
MKQQLHLRNKKMLNKRNANKALRHHNAGGHQAISQVFCQDSKNECQNIMEGPATAQAKEEATNSLWTSHSWKFCPHCLEKQ